MELNKNFSVLSTEEMMMIDADGVGTVLFVIGCVVAFSIGVYNGYCG